ncbi:MAG TPA: hypothetical protein VN461_05015 [Vicinamibacteria bacterium]|nr:hypothetical protein [Vicinamibacteria bacterium]
MGFETTPTRLWKRLSPEERLAAALSFWREPPSEVIGTALGLIVKARHMRPQAVRALAPEARARALALVLDPGDALASALLVALHMGERRPLLGVFLDAVGLRHEDGILKDEPPEVAPLGEESARAGVKALLAAFPRPQVETYLNTLWLQDPERWAVLQRQDLP